MKRSFVCAAWIGMALVGDALADESGLHESGLSEPGLYVRGDLGQAQTRDPFGRLVINEDEDDLSWSLAVGYRFNRYLAIDVGYGDLGELDGYLSSPLIEVSGRASVAVQGATVALVGMIPIDRWEPYLKAGVLFSQTEQRFIGQLAGFRTTLRYDQDSQDPFYGAGLRYAVTQPLRIYLDITYFDEVGGNNSYSSYLNASAGVLWQF